jgi:DNA-binding GntR family transcriptional regulator
MRVTLERFAFELAWDRRDDGFRSELGRRNEILSAAIEAGDDYGSIRAELDLHGLVYEASDHSLLQRAWAGLRGRLQLYWAAHHRAHGTRGPKSDSHDSYIAAALGDDLSAMLREIGEHMRRGAERTEQFLLTVEPASKLEKGRST